MHDEDDNTDLTLVPAILAALRDDRNEDAVGLARDLVEEDGGPMAVLKVAQIANFLHNNPNVPLEQLAMTISAHNMGMELTEPRTDGQIVADLLSVIAEREAANYAGQLSPESQHIIDQWGRRQSSSALIGLLCQMVSVLLADMKLQMVQPIFFMRSPEAAVRFALADADSVLRGGGALNVHASKWNDRQAPS